MILVTRCSITDFFDLADQLPEVTGRTLAATSEVAGNNQTYGYLWELTCTVGLKRTISQQLALVVERPETFKYSPPPVPSAGLRSDWGAERDELAEPAVRGAAEDRSRPG